MSDDWRGDVLRFWFGLDPGRDGGRPTPSSTRTSGKLPQVVDGAAPVSGREPSSTRSADRARRGHPVRPVSAQHVPRPCRPVRHRPSRAARSRRARGRPGLRRRARAARSAASSTCRSSTAKRCADQRRSLALFTALGDDYQLGFAKKHHDVIERFGRFPHRNAMLGRAAAPGRNRGRRRRSLVAE